MDYGQCLWQGHTRPATLPGFTLPSGGKEVVEGSCRGQSVDVASYSRIEANENARLGHAGLCRVSRDIVAEIIGAALGIALWLSAGERIMTLWSEVQGGPASGRALIVLYTVAYLGFALFPFDFLVSPAELAEKLDHHEPTPMPDIRLQALPQRPLLSISLFLCGGSPYRRVLKEAFGRIRRLLAILAGFAAFAAAGPGFAASWAPEHIVIVVLENRSFGQVINDPGMPYLNSLARGGALMTQSYFAQLPYGTVPTGWSAPLPARPSQPNYLYLFSGHHQGVTPSYFRAPASSYLGTASNDADGTRLPGPIANIPVGIGNSLIPARLRPFTTPNLGAAIIASGRTFASFSESLPYPRYDAPNDPNPDQDLYRRKHNPAINWIDLTARFVPSDRRKFVLSVEANLGFSNTRDPISGKSYRGFAVDANGNKIGFDELPMVSLVIPNEQHDLHSGDSATTDAWLRSNIKPYADWALTHDSLLIVTFDEDGSTDSSHGEPDATGIDRIATIFFGSIGKVIPGLYDERIDHLNVLSTILDRYGLLDQFKRDFLAVHTGVEAKQEYANLRPIKDVFGEGPKLAPLPKIGNDIFWQLR